jgi:hypothetical protein
MWSCGSDIDLQVHARQSPWSTPFCGVFTPGFYVEGFLAHPSCEWWTPLTIASPAVFKHSAVLVDFALRIVEVELEKRPLCSSVSGSELVIKTKRWASRSGKLSKTKKMESGWRSIWQKHTTGGIPRWSPTLVLVARFSAYVWQSGRSLCLFPSPYIKVKFKVSRVDFWR